LYAVAEVVGKRGEKENFQVTLSVLLYSFNLQFELTSSKEISASLSGGPF